MKSKPELVIRSILSMALFFCLLILITPIVLILLIVSFGQLTNFVVEKIAPLLAKPVFFVLGIRSSVTYHLDILPDSAVFIANHGSTIDMFSILALGLPRVRFIAKWELQYNPLFFILGRLTGQVFIKRQNSKEAVATLQQSYDKVRRKNLSIFAAPEGSRKHPGIIGPFKKGPFRTAMDLGYPIVPIYFEGNQRLSNGGSLVTRKGNITAHIHSPIATDEWTLENLDDKINEVRDLYIQWAAKDYGFPRHKIVDSASSTA